MSEQKNVPQQNERMGNINNNFSTFNQIDKIYTLSNLANKLNRTEPVTFGNYFVNFNEMFQKESDYKDYMKKKVSLFNDDIANKPSYNGKQGQFLKPCYFEKFSDETLFYIFYYMPRDILQLFAAEQLYKKGWKYHVEYQIWFTDMNKMDKNENNTTNNDNGNNSNDNLIYFNPLEWKCNQYVYEKINKDEFLNEEEAAKYVTQLKIKSDTRHSSKDHKEKKDNKEGNNQENK